MKAERILNALGQVDDIYVGEADPLREAAVSPHHRRPPHRALIAVAAAAALLLSTFTAAMAASESFRSTVFRFLHIEAPDIVLPIEDEPGQTGEISHIGSTTLDGTVSVEYIRVDGTFDYGNGIIHLYQDGAPATAYAVENGQLTALEAHSESLEYAWNGLTYSIRFNWYEKGGTVYANARGFDMDTSAAWEVSAVAGNADYVALTISCGQQIEYAQYPLLYDLRTKNVIDLLDGCEELQSRRISQGKISADLSGVLVSCGPGGGLFYYDINTRTLLSLNDLCGRDLKDAWFMDSSTVCCLSEEKDGTYTCDRVELSTRRCTEIFAALPELDDGSGSGIVFTGGRYSLFIGEGRSTFVYDLKTGERAIVDGFQYPADNTFAALNRTGDKLLFVRTDDGADGLGVSEIGVLNLKFRTFTLFDRDNYAARREISIGWFDEDTAAIQASAGGYGYLYLFTVDAP